MTEQSIINCKLKSDIVIIKENNMNFKLQRINNSITKIPLDQTKLKQVNVLASELNKINTVHPGLVIEGIDQYTNYELVGEFTRTGSRVVIPRRDEINANGLSIAWKNISTGFSNFLYSIYNCIFLILFLCIIIIILIFVIYIVIKCNCIGKIRDKVRIVCKKEKLEDNCDRRRNCAQSLTMSRTKR
jgi:hypothetical protein